MAVPLHYGARMQCRTSRLREYALLLLGIAGAIGYLLALRLAG
jgi:hypothetical protein